MLTLPLKFNLFKSWRRIVARKDTVTLFCTIFSAVTGRSMKFMSSSLLQACNFTKNMKTLQMFPLKFCDNFQNKSIVEHLVIGSLAKFFFFDKSGMMTASKGSLGYPAPGPHIRPSAPGPRPHKSSTFS